MSVRDEVVRVLNEIVDPCSRAAGAPAGLIDMGLVRDLEVGPRADGTWGVRLSIKVTEPSCIMGAAFLVEARRRLAAMSGIGSVDVNLDHVMDWSPSDMTPAYQARLESTRVQRRGALAATAVVRRVHLKA